MARSGPVWLIAGILILGACSTQRPPGRDGKVQEGSDTVYDHAEGNRSSNPFSDDEEIVEDPSGYSGYEGGIASDSIDLNTRELPSGVDLDWHAVYFEFDSAVLTEQARQQLSGYAQTLKDHTNLTVLLEGHCDRRGTENYNLALGERRAQSVKRYLVQLGVASDQMQTISYGELRPADAAENERAWALNRRVGFTF